MKINIYFKVFAVCVGRRRIVYFQL